MIQTFTNLGIPKLSHTQRLLVLVSKVLAKLAKRGHVELGYGKMILPRYLELRGWLGSNSVGMKLLDYGLTQDAFLSNKQHP